jgi:hypothetical protein
MATDPHQISVAEAAALTLRWRRNKPPTSINGARFERIAFDNLLNQPGCAGIRIYLALHDPADPKQAKDASMWTFVMIGTDAEDNDMIPPQAMSGTDSGTGGPEQEPLPCPPVCGDPSPLNDPP